MSNDVRSHKATRRIVPNQEGFRTTKQDENNKNNKNNIINGRPAWSSSSFSSSSQDKAADSTRPKTPRVYAYTICNGLSNQLLHHAAHLSKAKRLGYQHVAIPNHFILQGTQTSDVDVGVTSQNSIPFGHAFDAQHFLHVLQTQLQLQAQFVDQTTNMLLMDNPTNVTHGASSTTTRTPRCLKLSQAFKGSDPVQVRILLQSAFRPSREHMEPIVETILRRLRSSSSSSSNDNDPYSHGVCLHDRNGQDWIDHCRRWSSIHDGIYRGNCLPYLPHTKEESSSSIEFLDNLKARVFPDPPPPEAAMAVATGQPPGPQRWVYYCGDYTDIPSTLLQASASYQESNGEDQNLLSHDNNNKTKRRSTTPLYSHITSRHLLLEQEKERQQHQKQQEQSNLSWSSFFRNGRLHRDTTSLPSSSLHELLAQQQRILSTKYGFSSQLDLQRDARDFFALLDFYVCRTLPRFVGNSVSTFSAIQIALRQPSSSSSLVVDQPQPSDPNRLPSSSSREGLKSTDVAPAPSTQTRTLTPGAAYWYNSQSIPLSQFWKTYEIPIVYTYTEESMASGKHFLQASIASVRHHMPHTPIHILYHGQADIEFRNWLQQTPNHVILHTHNPTWAADIEEMRLHGDVQRSHLFLHAGNYLGTWQRIDIPLFVDAEYALLLDSDTIVQKPLSLRDFGLYMTHGLAMSSELKYPEQKPANAGIMLMNIPFLRETHSAFIKYIVEHKSTGGQFRHHPSPSDQGAYLTFYGDRTRFLPYKFNMKPYFPLQSSPSREGDPSPPPPKLYKFNMKPHIPLPSPPSRKGDPSPPPPHKLQNMKIVHFHGPKPHEYIAYIAFGKNCPEASNFLCTRGWAQAPSSLCHALSIFAQASLSVTHSTIAMGTPSSKMGYCQASFPANPLHAQTCQKILEALVTASRQNKSDDGYGIPYVCTSADRGAFARFIITTVVEAQRLPLETTTTTTLHNTTAPSLGGGESSVVYDHQSPCSSIPEHLLPYPDSPQQQPLHRRSMTFYLVFILLASSALLSSTVWSWLGPPLQRRRSSSGKNSESNNDNSNNATRLKRLVTPLSRLHEQDESQQKESSSQAWRGKLKRFQLFMILCLAFSWEYWQTLQVSSYVVNNNNNKVGPPLQQQQQQQQQFYQSPQYPQPLPPQSQSQLQQHQ